MKRNSTMPIDVHDRLDLHHIMRAQAEALADAIRASLDIAPGGDHRTPWRQSGQLAASIAVEATPEGFIVGSTSPVALAQELGTPHIPPRPFLAPAAMAHAASVAQEIGAAAAAQVEIQLRRR
jgi:hypothetical protein